MANWIWNRKQTQEERVSPEAPETPGRPFAEAADLEIEKKWLQLVAVDPENFEFFYRKYYHRLLSFIGGQVQDPEVAQDLTQEVFSRALDRLDKFRWQGYSFGAWLFRIARNLITDEGRRLGQLPLDSGSVEDCPNQEPSQPDDGLLRSDEDRILRHCIARLDPVSRQIIQAHYWTGLKVREIAIVFEMSESKIKSRLSRAREQLQDCLSRQQLAENRTDGRWPRIRMQMAKEDGWKILDDRD